MPSENIRAAMSNKNDNMAVSNISKKAKDLSRRAGPQTTTKTPKTIIKLKIQNNLLYRFALNNIINYKISSGKPKSISLIP